MCNFASMLVKRNGDVLWQAGVDSHDELLTKFQLRDQTDDPALLAFARVEITPPAGDVFAPVEQWRFKIDEQITPTWWSENHERSAWAALRSFLAVVRVDGGELGKFENRNGLYVRNAKIDALNNCHVAQLISSSVGEMREGSTVGVMRGSSTVDEMRESSTVGEMRGSSTVGEMRESSTVGEMRESSTVREMREGSTVRVMWGSSTVGVMWEGSTVRVMWESSTVRVMWGSSTVGEMWGSSTVREMREGSTVGEMWGSSVALRREVGKIELLHAPGISVVNTEIKK